MMCITNHVLCHSCHCEVSVSAIAFGHFPLRGTSGMISPLSLSPSVITDQILIESCIFIWWHVYFYWSGHQGHLTSHSEWGQMKMNKWNMHSNIVVSFTILLQWLVEVVFLSSFIHFFPKSWKFWNVCIHSGGATIRDVCVQIWLRAEKGL